MRSGYGFVERDFGGGTWLDDNGTALITEDTVTGQSAVAQVRLRSSKHVLASCSIAEALQLGDVEGSRRHSVAWA